MPPPGPGETGARLGHVVVAAPAAADMRAARGSPLAWLNGPAPAAASGAGGGGDRLDVIMSCLANAGVDGGPPQGYEVVVPAETATRRGGRGGRGVLHDRRRTCEAEPRCSAAFFFFLSSSLFVGHFPAQPNGLFHNLILAPL